MKENINPMLIATCVFTAFFTFTAVTFNVVAILALGRTLALPKNLKVLLLSLAVSDFGVGLIAQPLIFAIIIMGIEENYNPAILATAERAYYVTMNLLCLASFLSVFALAVDRFLAVHLHLRYQQLVTYKRVVSAVISLWVLSILLALLTVWDEQNAFVIGYIIMIVCLIVTAFIYFKIYLAVKHHTEQIIALQIHPREEIDKETTLNAERQKKPVVMIFCVYLVFVVCYLPNAIVIVFSIAGRVKVHQNVSFVTDMLVFLNSSLNPLIYCWKMKPIQQVVKSMLQNIFSCHD